MEKSNERTIEDVSRAFDTGNRVYESARMSIWPKTERIDLEIPDKAHPSHVMTWEGNPTDLAGGSHYLVVTDGEAVLNHDSATFRLPRGYYATLAGAAQITGSGRALVVTNQHHASMALLGGPVESEGRLRYVDGCTASLLLPPSVRGDPCLNFLSLPKNTAQTPHSHPTMRVGLILSGNGACETNLGLHPFLAGSTFLIPPGVVHSFQSRDESLRIVIYHPDSDSGPTHEDHTMLNRTFVAGASARELQHLHTR